VPDIEACVEPHIPALRRFAWALIRNREEADDLVQDCLERAISRWQLRRSDGDVKAWLFTILRNLHISRWRRDRRRGPVLSLDEMGDPPASSSQPDQTLAAKDVLASLNELPEDQKSVILLIGVEDMSYQQAADILGVPVGTVMSRLSRGRERLRLRLESGRGPLLRRVK
jgi:RNA polymerase sigma factor (sigma-70 family)